LCGGGFDQGLCIFDFLAGHKAGREKPPATLQVSLVLPQIDFINRNLGAGLFNPRLKAARVNLSDNVAFPYARTNRYIQSFDDSRKLRADAYFGTDPKPDGPGCGNRGLQDSQLRLNE